MVIDRLQILLNQQTGKYHPVALVLLELEGHPFPENHAEQWVLHQQGFEALEDARDHIVSNPDFVHVTQLVDQAVVWDGELASLGQVSGEHQA